MAQLVYAFGLCQPISGLSYIMQQLRLAHLYYNQLVQIEHAKREAIRARQREFEGLAECYDRLDAAECRVDALYAQKDLAKGHGSKIAAPTAAGIAEAKAQRAAINKELKVLKEKYDEQLMPLYKEIDEEFAGRRRTARKNSGVYWGTYQLVEASVDQAIQAKPDFFGPDGKPRKIKPWLERPGFKGFSGMNRGRGRLSVQIMQDEGALENIFSEENKKAYIAPLPENAFSKDVPRGERKKLQRTTFRMRITRPDEKTGEVGYAEWPLYMHRPIPPDARITRVTVLRIPWRQGFEYRWKLLVSVEIPDPPAKDGYPMVAVNLGWRRMRDGALRVATWVGTDGQSGELRLSRADFRDRLEKASSIRGIRDTNMDQIKVVLKALGIPCGRWRAAKRFYDLLDPNKWIFAESEDELAELTPEEKKLKHCVFSRETHQAVRAALIPWVARDKHLWWYERGCRTGALNYRKEQYRLFALQLATQYRTMVIENYDLRGIVEDEYRLPEPAHQRVEAAPYEARAMLTNAGHRQGCCVLNGKSTLATQQCNRCGCKIRWDAAPDIMHTCVKCGETWDQDVNNAINLLARATRDWPDLPPGEGHRVKKAARFANKGKKQKQQQQQQSSEAVLQEELSATL